MGYSEGQTVGFGVLNPQIMLGSIHHSKCPNISKYPRKYPNNITCFHISPDMQCKAVPPSYANVCQFINPVNTSWLS